MQYLDKKIQPVVEGEGGEGIKTDISRCALNTVLLI